MRATLWKISYGEKLKPKISTHTLLEKNLPNFANCFRLDEEKTLVEFFFWERTQIHFVLLPFCSKIWLIFSKLFFDLKRRKHCTNIFSEKNYSYTFCSYFAQRNLTDVLQNVLNDFELIVRKDWTKVFRRELTALYLNSNFV